MTIDEAAEEIRRELALVLNITAADRPVLTELYGQVWDTDELGRDFEVHGFAAPLVVARRKSDGKLGSLLFQHEPRFYFGWKEYLPEKKEKEEAA